MNVADSERAATGLEKAGFNLVASADAADVVLLNTCSVRERAERRVYTRVGQCRRPGPQEETSSWRDGLRRTIGGLCDFR